MAQNSNEHLSSIRLSAYADKELAPEELALCDAHLSSCQHCQAILADLRLTASLTRQLPQVEVPRSFALPLNLTTLPAIADAESTRLSDKRRQARWKNVLRPLSALAAIVGMLFILVGLCGFTPLSKGIVATNTTTSSGNYAAQAPRTTGTVISASTPPDARSPQEQAATPAIARPTTVSNGDHGQDLGTAYRSVRTPPPLLDPGQPEGRLSIGALLLLLGILGLLFTRRISQHKT